MIKKLIYPILGLILLCGLILPAQAISPQPIITLDDYEMGVSYTKGVYIEGEVSKACGQWIQLHADTKNYAINHITVPNTGKKEEFKIYVPDSYLKNGKNTFYVMSKAVKGKLSASNFKTVTIEVVTSDSGKKSQTITANNMTLTVGQEVSINAKASSGLPLLYSTDNQNATVDSNGGIIARQVGTTKVTIKQNGNSTYSAVSKVITVTVTNGSTNNNTLNKTSTVKSLKTPKIKSITSTNNKATLKYTVDNNSQKVEIYNSKTKKTYTTSNKTTYIQLKLKASTSYKYKIRTYVVSNGKKIYSKWSAYKIVKTKKKSSSKKSSGNSDNNSGSSNNKSSGSNKGSTKCSHEYKIVKTVDNDCTSKAYSLKRCKKCGKEYKKYKKFGKKGKHSKKTETKDATCEKKGYKKTYCTKCKTTLSKKTIPAKGHSWGKTQTGKKWIYKKCKRCGKAKVLGKNTINTPWGP